MSKKTLLKVWVEGDLKNLLMKETNKKVRTIWICFVWTFTPTITKLLLEQRWFVSFMLILDPICTWWSRITFLLNVVKWYKSWCVKLSKKNKIYLLLPTIVLLWHYIRKLLKTYPFEHLKLACQWVYKIKIP